MTYTTRQSLITTNIRIPEEELLTYREYALSEGKSFSQLVREILAQAIIPAPVKIKSVSKKKKRSFWDIDKYAVKSGDPKTSQKIDQYVYNL
jgi:hypothetical protein